MSSTKQQLFVLSVLSLFLELLVIRYIGTEIIVFGHFKNLSLMSAFLGLGLGFIFAKSKRDYFQWSAIAFLFLSGILITAAPLGLTLLSFHPEGGFAGYWDMGPFWQSVQTILIVLGIFSLSAFSFLGIGQRLGQLFDELKPLEAYAINVAGALIGTLLFSLLSYLQTGPGVWLVVAGLLFVCVSRKPAHFAVIALGLIYGLFLANFFAARYYGADFVETLWSPYYRIDVCKAMIGGKQPQQLGYDLKVSYGSFQVLLDCSPANLAHFSPAVQKAMLGSYSAPYLIQKSPAKSVLILASGNGSDVIGACASGVGEVDAVDIDPALTNLGKTLHPQKPYLRPNVHLSVMDARTFLKTTKKKYDLIVFDYLDSHVAFSCLSSLRTENYVFTKQAYQDAYRHLNKDGVIVVNFICITNWLWDRQSKTLALATAMTPLGFFSHGDKSDVGCLVAGPGVPDLNPAALAKLGQARTVNLASGIEPTTDDWPFLYLPARGLSPTYFWPLVAVAFLSFLAVRKSIYQGMRNRLNWLMLLLGMGFMLMEVRAMTNLAILFGSTWIVNSLVIAGVLIVILLGNYAAMKLSERAILPCAVLLFLALAVSNMVPAATLAACGQLLGSLLGILIYVLPITFAAIIFSLLFKGTKAAGTALGFNLFGGVLGICLESLSMALGMTALGWIAMSIYGAAIVAYLLTDRASNTTQVNL